MSSTTTFPVTPYAGSSGHSGGDTSKARADKRDESGVTGENQQAVLHWLSMRGPKGATWVETGTFLNCHHGSASSVLSNLHKDGLIARLKEQRDNCFIYVGLDHVNNRQTEKQGRQKISEEERATLADIRARLLDEKPIEDHELFGMLLLIDRLIA